MNYPPMHPRCRCTIIPALGESLPVKRRSRIAENRTKVGDVSYSEWLGRYVNTLKPYRAESNYQVLNRTSTITGDFDELKRYWAENYNVKVADGIKKLHFETVRETMSGVEAVIKEFPPAVAHLKEFSLLEKGIMSTSRQSGIINFNPEYFRSEEKVLSTINAGVQSGYYPQNMNLAGVGAHEMGHILEDWLIAKYGGGVESVKSRVFAKKLIHTSYVEVMRSFRTASEVKTLNQLIKELGEYATKNASECLATAVSDYVINRSRADVFSKSIWNSLKKELE